MLPALDFNLDATLPAKVVIPELFHINPTVFVHAHAAKATEKELVLSLGTPLDRAGCHLNCLAMGEALAEKTPHFGQARPENGLSSPAFTYLEARQLHKSSAGHSRLLLEPPKEKRSSQEGIQLSLGALQGAMLSWEAEEPTKQLWELIFFPRFYVGRKGGDILRVLGAQHPAGTFHPRSTASFYAPADRQH